MTAAPPGSRYGWITLIGTASHPCRGQQCLVRCDCGREFTLALSCLKSFKSCGCLHHKKMEAVERLWVIARALITPCCGDEQWKWIAGAEARHLISSCGRVYSMNLQRFLPGTADHAGYLHVYLGNNENRRRSIHRLVMAAFSEPRPAGMQARHLDGNQLNCHLSNLRWGTPQENSDDKRRHGTLQLGEAHHSAVLTADLVRFIRRSFAEGVRNNEIAHALNVHNETVRAVLKGRTWSHVV